jgi:hypothetical protein
VEIRNAINLADKLATFSDYWQPRVVGSFNGHDLMVVKVKGEFVWHKHDDTDDFLGTSQFSCGMAPFGSVQAKYSSCPRA